MPNAAESILLINSCDRRPLCNSPLHNDRSLGEFVSISVYLTLEEVVERYRNQVSEGALRNWRSKRIGHSFIKIGKAVLYPVNELDRWDRSNLVLCQRTRHLPFDTVGTETSEI
jgi:hypothetical protein